MREHSGQHEEDVAPAEQVAQHAARGLAEQLAHDLSAEIAREHRLALLVRRHVADIGHGDRNDPAGGRPRGKASERERRKRMDGAAQRNQHACERAHGGDRAILAEAVADRPDDELNRAVAHRVGGDNDRGFADRGAEISRDLG